MANYRSFLTGLAGTAAQGIKERRDEERDLAKTMSSLIMKAQLEQQMKDPLEQEYKRAQIDKMKRDMEQPSEWKPTSKEDYFEALDRKRSGQQQVIGQDEEGKPVYGPSADASMDKIEQEKKNAEDLFGTIQEVKEGANYFGPFGNVPTQITSLGGIVDYDKRKKWENNMDRLINIKWLDTIKSLKNASKTGASGLGSLTEAEGKRLEKAATALSKDLGKATALKYLKEMEEPLAKLLNVSGSAGSSTGTQTFKVDGKVYSIPSNEVEAFKSEMGL